MSKKAIHNIVSYNKVDLGRIQFTELNESDRIPSQKIAYVSYDDPKKGSNQFDIQTPELLLDNYGIPDGDGPFYPTNKSRAFVKVPLDINENVETETEAERSDRKAKLASFKEFLINFDKMIEGKKEEFFGKKNVKKYSYQPIVRQAMKAQDDDEDEDDSDEKVEKEVIFRPDYMKTKVPLNYSSEAIETEIYRKNKENTIEFESDGKYSKLEVEGLDDMRNHVRYMRKMKFVMHVSKLWASKQVTAGTDTKKFGVTFKLCRVEVQQRADSRPETVFEMDTPFIDSDDDEEEVTAVKASTKIAEEVDESEEESDEESEEESEEAAPPPPKKKTAKSKKA